MSIVGWAVFGLGLSSMAPTILGAARGVTGIPVPAAITAVTILGYLGSFTGPPLIGVLAQLSTLRTALWLLAAVLLLGETWLSVRELRQSRVARRDVLS